ncbi:MAG TPA: caspase family protein [Polyangiaceae bacterium]|nr:caspase family protein [Polyangiaceae bacterium]
MSRAFWVLVGVLSSLVPWSASAAAAVERYAVIIGNNRGEADEPELRFAEADGARMHGVLRDVAGFQPDRMLLLRGESAAVVERSLIGMNDRIRAAQSRPGVQVMLFVYFSGHADAQALHLNKTTLELSLIEQLVRSSAAAFRVLVVDACRSGALTRVKGGVAAPAFDIKIDEALSGEGTVFLTSSSANEDAQESDALGGSFFTHYFASGLLGPADQDRDGRITLDEAYRYAHENTLRASSRTLAGVQHPTFRYDLRGQGRLVLSEPFADRANRTILGFPPGRQYLVFAGDDGGPVEGEIGAHDAVRLLSVRPGKHYVRGRGPAFLLEGNIEVAGAEQFLVTDERLHRVDYAELARKGGAGAPLIHGPELGYSLRTELHNDAGLCHGVFAGYAFVLPMVTLTPRVAYCRSGFQNAQLSATIDTWDATLHGQHTWDFSSVSLALGADIGAALFHQRFETPGLAPSRTTGGGEAGVDGGVGVALGHGFGLFLESGADVYVFSVEHSETHQHEAVASAAFRQRVGLQKLW